MSGLFKKKLPHCDDLFVRYLAPWYRADERPNMTRPDMYVISGFNGNPIDLDAIQYLPPQILTMNADQIAEMVQAATVDYQNIVAFEKLDLNVIEAVDRHYDRKRIKALIDSSDPSDFGNDYLVSIGEFGASLGELFCQRGGFGWLYSHPYFHSIIVHKETGYGITVFDWAVKKFSEYGVDDGFAAKFNMALDNIEEQLRGK